MSRLAKEYQRYQNSNVMQKLAAYAHGEHYEGQTSSATFPEIYQLLNQLSLPRHASILDLGCGTGTFTKQLFKQLDYRVTGVDLSQSLIDHAIHIAQMEGIEEYCKYKTDDFVFLNTLDRSQRFDCMLSIGSLYWNQPLDKALSTWKHHLAEYGYLIIFSNLTIMDLTGEELKCIGETKFIKKVDLIRVFHAFNFKTILWENKTSNYITWLYKWCEGMGQFETEIYKEMGLENGNLLIARFQTYLKLALQNKVLREIIVVQKEVL